MEKKIRQKCKEAGIDPKVLTEEEKKELIEEIEAEEKGFSVLDGVLSNPDLLFREIKA